MRSENPDAIRESAAIGRGIGVPVACSILLHGLVLGLFVRASFAPPAEAGIRQERAYLSIALDLRPPPRAPENAAQDTDVVPEPELVEEPVEELVEATETAEATDTDVAELAPAAELDESAIEPDAAVPIWTPATLRAAVGTYVTNQQTTLTESWVAGCLIEQKQHGTRDCERQLQASDHTSASARAGRDVAAGTFAELTRRTRYALLTEGFEKKNTVMKDLMTDPGVLGQLATDRYFLNREYVFYLNGNPSPYGAANQFRCKKKGKVMAVTCTYEYTGFVVVRPDAVVAEDEFRVVPTLFGPAR